MPKTAGKPAKRKNSKNSKAASHPKTKKGFIDSK